MHRFIYFYCTSYFQGLPGSGTGGNSAGQYKNQLSSSSSSFFATSSSFKVDKENTGVSSVGPSFESKQQIQPQSASQEKSPSVRASLDEDQK
jgi:hypothetical protein